MGRLIDARGRILGKINVIDLVVFLVVVAVVVLAVVRLTGGTSASVPVRVTFAVEGVRQPTVDALNVGSVVQNEAGTVLGIVRDIVITPTREEFITPQGELKAFDSPIFKDVRVVVEGQGKLSGSTVRIGSLPLRVGKKVTLVGPGFEVQTAIVSVDWGANTLGASTTTEAGK